MNAGGSEGSTIILIDQPSTPIFGDLNYASVTGLINGAYGRYHDPFLNVPLSESALALIDPGSKKAPNMWCTGRETCAIDNQKYIDGRLDDIIAANLGQPVYPSTLNGRFNFLVFPPAHGGAVDPMWYDWTTSTTTKRTTTTTTKKATTKKAAVRGGFKDRDQEFYEEEDDQEDEVEVEDNSEDSISTTMMAGSDASSSAAGGEVPSTDADLNPDPHFANNCSCEYLVTVDELAMTLISTAGVSSIITGLLLSSAWRDLADPVGAEGIWEQQSQGTDDSFEQMLAE